MGPLATLKVVEFSGLGPAPLAGQLLADLGAEVIAIDRASVARDPTDINRRGKRSVALNLKTEAGRQAALRLIEKADVLIEGFRPGVMEKLGLGPGDCPERLIYARMTGWGQEGPLSQTAGHDISYLALTGALHMMGYGDRPPLPPINLAADYGGGSMFLIFGILSALFERGVSGKGQIVDAAMVDGVPAMMGLLHSLMAKGYWTETREANLLDGGAPFYRCYACACGGYLAVGALEPQFFAEFVRIAGLPAEECETQMDRAKWPEKRARYAELIGSKTRDQWAALFEGSDACVAPILTTAEAAAHPHNIARTLFGGDVLQAAPAPRFSRSTPASFPDIREAGADTEVILTELGYDAGEIQTMRKSGVLT